MAREIIGLDIGSFSIKAALLRNALRGGVQAVEFIEREVPRTAGLSQEERTTEALKGLLRDEAIRLGRRSDQVVVSLPGHRVSLRILSLPFSERKKIEQVLSFEVEGLLPFSAEEVAIGYHILETREGHSRVLTAAISKEFLKRYLDALKEGGLDPQALEIDSLSLYNFSRQFLKDVTGGYCLIDMGASKTSLCVMDGETLLSVRTIPLGGEVLTQALQEELSLRWEDAEGRKKEIGLDGKDTSSSSEKAVSQVLWRSVESLVAEVERTLHITEAENGRPISRLYICGGASALKGLADLLAQKTEREVIRLKGPMVTSAAGQSREALPPGVGLALKEILGGRGSQVNFRRGEFARGKDEEKATRRLVPLKVGGALLVLLVAGDLSVRYYVKEARYRELKAEVRKTFTEALPEVKNVVDELQQLKVAVKDAQKKAALFESSSITGLRLLAELTTRMPRGIDVSVQEVIAENGAVRLEAETTSFDAVDRVKGELEKVEGFKEIAVSDAKVTADQKRVKFRMTIKVAAQQSP